MLNIISRSVVSRYTSGPKKVVDNLIKGLEQLKYPFVINAALDACPRVWIHDDRDALREVLALRNVSPIVGPNLYVTPREIPTDLDLSRTLYLHPSEWSADLWRRSGFDRAPLAAWPAGIDTDEYVPSPAAKEYVLIYVKERSEKERERVIATLEDLHTPYRILTYGLYTEKKYKSLLASARYMIWLGRQESQGIALEEALAANVPILVWDVTHFGHRESLPRYLEVFTPEELAFTGATAAYYFDDRCGKKIKDGNELPKAIRDMNATWTSFTPRAYILENLSLKKQALDLLTFYETHFDLPVAAGYAEKTVRRPGTWKNASPLFLLQTLCKDFLKYFLVWTHRRAR